MRVSGWRIESVPGTPGTSAERPRFPPAPLGCALIERSESIDPMALELEDWPLEPDQIVDGDPQVSGRVLDASADGKVERGVWRRTAGRLPRHRVRRALRRA